MGKRKLETRALAWLGVTAHLAFQRTREPENIPGVTGIRRFVGELRDDSITMARSAWGLGLVVLGEVAAMATFRPDLPRALAVLLPWVSRGFVVAGSLLLLWLSRVRRTSARPVCLLFVTSAHRSHVHLEDVLDTIRREVRVRETWVVIDELGRAKRIALVAGDGVRCFAADGDSFVECRRVERARSLSAPAPRAAAARVAQDERDRSPACSHERSGKGAPATR
ncbi:MAG TPA: hypothetical protein VG755_18845 [Nannocystaceae bacterium]|nr:hypothetical protein [Nannocystaceae bacterium]